MTFCLILVLSWQGPDLLVLETGSARLDQVTYGRVGLAEGGGFLAASKQFLWHWDAHGALINKVGGPELIGLVGTFHWDGNYYWLVDDWHADSLLFDRSGTLVSRFPIHYHQFIALDRRLFVLDSRNLRLGGRVYPPVLYEIQYQIRDGTLGITNLGPGFKRITPRQQSFRNNFKMVWVVPENHRLLVVDQLEPKIWIYDAAVIARERNLPLHQPLLPRSIPLQLTEYILPPFADDPGGDFITWLHSWSRINHFAAQEKGYLVGYDIPDPERARETLQVVQGVDRSGRATGQLLRTRGYLMGIRNGSVLIFQERKGSDGIDYVVEAHAF